MRSTILQFYIVVRRCSSISTIIFLDSYLFLVFAAVVALEITQGISIGTNNTDIFCDGKSLGFVNRKHGETCVCHSICERQFCACGLFTLGFPQYLNSPTHIDFSSSVSLTAVSHDNNSLPVAADSCASSVRLCVTSLLHMAILCKKPNKWLSEIFTYWNECRSLSFKLTSHFSQPESIHPCSSSSSPSVYFSVYLVWMFHPAACTDYKAKPVKIASQDQTLALFC